MLTITWVINITTFIFLLVYIKKLYSAPLVKTLPVLFNDSIIAVRNIVRYCFHIILLFIMIAGISASVIFASKYLTTVKEFEQTKKADANKFNMLAGFYKKPVVNIDIKNIPVFSGNPKAGITIVEYIDLNCQACRHSIKKMVRIIERYPDQVKLYIKHFPLDKTCNPFVDRQLNGTLCMAAVMAIALRDTPMYVPFISAIINGNEIEVADDLKGILDKIGINFETMSPRFYDDNNKKILYNEITEMTGLGASGIPLMVINGRVMGSGILPEDLLNAIILMEINRVTGGK